MERTNHPLSVNNKALATFASALVARANLSAKLGMQYEGDRNLYQALGYKTTLVYRDYLAQYIRQDMAAAIIDRPVKATWQGELLLQENKDDNDTALEEAWKTLSDELSLKSVFSRIDRLCGIGKYGVLLLGLDDVQTNEGFVIPVTSGPRKLLYLMPFGEGSALVNKYEQAPTNPRYGRPLTYNLQITDSSSKSITIEVHYTRVLHIVDDPLESDVEGAPRLEKVFNRLMDLEKLVGGSAEMFWRNARPGYSADVDKDYQMTQATKDGLKDQIDEYEHNLRRILTLEGVKLNSLSQPTADPRPSVDVQIQMISAVTGIPKRILTGSERGELSSGQDSDELKVYIQGRREEHAEFRIIRPFVNLCIKYGILPKPSTGKYEVVWSDLFAKSEAEVVKIGVDRSTSLKNYVSTPGAEAVVPPEAFFEFFLGLSTEQIELIQEMAESHMGEEQLLYVEPTEVGEVKPTIPEVSKK